MSLARAYAADVPDTVVELLEFCRERAAREPEWLGSEEHRLLLEGALAPVFGVHEVALDWAAPGHPSFWEQASRRITVERPGVHPGVAPADVAEYTLLGVLHESLHARHTGSVGSYSRERDLEPLGWQPIVERLFNLCEDGRITARGAEADPELDGPLERWLGETVRQMLCEYRTREGEPASTVDPGSQRSQLLMAVLLYAVAPGEPLTLHPVVAGEFASLRPVLDAARVGGTEESGLAAVQAIRTIRGAALAS